jgi:hypothetical protein
MKNVGGGHGEAQQGKEGQDTALLFLEDAVVLLNICLFSEFSPGPANKKNSFRKMN